MKGIILQKLIIKCISNLFFFLLRKFLLMGSKSFQFMASYKFFKFIEFLNFFNFQIFFIGHYSQWLGIDFWKNLKHILLHSKAILALWLLIIIFFSIPYWVFSAI
ncbi:unnamed protein product [Blepharisma stoltei]|uniref:Uncharacterized protein n=1 Tax=Blepharisma stoltei TaxID=1481888 RepID=A0AAU9K847_9CILI|nr:unnamed protein product [Blepharisma stoltei]